MAVLASAALAGAALAACGGSGARASSAHATSAADAGWHSWHETIARRREHSGVYAEVSAGHCRRSTARHLRDRAGERRPLPVPDSVAQSFADRGDAATNSACKKVAPPRIPASWRPTLRRLAAVKACLKRGGIASGGGSLAGFESYPDMPIGALLMPGPTRPTSIAFYASDAKASQAYARVRANVANEGGTMIRHGQLLIVWGSLPIAKVHAGEEHCALHP